MKNPTLSTKLSRYALLLAGVALSFSTLSVCVKPTFAAPQSTTIATKSQPPASDTITQAIQKLRQSKQRWIEVNRKTQRLIVWEGNRPLHAVIVSTGKSSTPTLTGVFSVQVKYRVTRMQGDDYDVPDVPFTMYYDGGYAIHGAYWHNKFGTPVSHGCVNLAVDQAERIFNLASVGTPVVVHD